MITGIVSTANALLSQARRVIHTHPKQLTAAVAALLLGGGGGAFALANFAPDASNLAVREVVESVQTLPLHTAADMGLQPLTLYRSDITRSSDTADTLLKRLGIQDTGAAAFLRTDTNARQVLLGRAGRNVTVEASEFNTLLKLSARWSPEDDGNFKRLVLEKTDQGFQSRIETAALSASTRIASGTIQSSLFAATDEAKINDNVAIQLAEIFSGDIDFHRALRKGDRFSVVYEALEGDGEPLRTGRVLSAEFVNNGKTFQAMWFPSPLAGNTAGNTAGQVIANSSATTPANATSKGAYYTLDGKSLRRSFLASPMEFSRVTSGFAMRFHPILQKWRAHLGVDYAAPTGTPVRSIGDGIVEFAGVQNGFGNVVFIKHGGQNTTVYAHLSRINVKKGQSVTQSQNIGAVGATGWATGPHLHFEFRVDGQHRDPLTLARQSEAVPVTAALKPQFDKLASGVRLQLTAAATLQQTSTQ